MTDVPATTTACGPRPLVADQAVRDRDRGANSGAAAARLAARGRRRRRGLRCVEREARARLSRPGVRLHLRRHVGDRNRDGSRDGDARRGGAGLGLRRHRVRRRAGDRQPAHVRDVGTAAEARKDRVGDEVQRDGGADPERRTASAAVLGLRLRGRRRAGRRGERDVAGAGVERGRGPDARLRREGSVPASRRRRQSRRRPRRRSPRRRTSRSSMRRGRRRQTRRQCRRGMRRR